MKRQPWLPIAAMLVCACADEPREPWKDELQFEWHGEYVSVHGYDRTLEQVCGEALEVTDRHAAAIVDLYADDVPVHVDYHWFSWAYWQDTEDVRPCADDSCSYLGDVYSPVLAYAHEIAHGVAWDADGQGNSTLSEGFAESLANASPRVSPSPPAWSPIEDILAYDETTDLRLAGDDYEQAGHFVSFLIEHYGLEAFRGIYRTVPGDASLADWDAATRGAIGLSLDDVLADYSSHPVCSHHGYRARLLDCAGMPDLQVSPTEPTSFTLRMRLSGLHAFIFFLPADMARHVEVTITPTGKPL